MTKHTFKVGDQVTVKDHAEHGVSTIDVPFKNGYYLTSEFGDFFWINSKELEPYIEKRGRKKKVKSDPIQQILNAEPGAKLKEFGYECCPICGVRSILNEPLRKEFDKFWDENINENGVDAVWTWFISHFYTYLAPTPKTYSFQGETMTKEQILKKLEEDK